MIYWFAYFMTVFLVTIFGPVLAQLDHSTASGVVIALGMAATAIIGAAKERAENEEA